MLSCQKASECRLGDGHAGDCEFPLKFYAVVAYYDYEGYGPPTDEPLFRTREAAEARAAELNDRHVDWDVHEMTVAP